MAAPTAFRFYDVNDQVTTAPPGSPGDFQAWAIAVGATGDWAGEDGNMGVWDPTSGASGKWRFITPVSGNFLFDQSTTKVYYHYAGSWIELVSSAARGNLDMAGWNILDLVKMSSALGTITIDAGVNLVLKASADVTLESTGSGKIWVKDKSQFDAPVVLLAGAPLQLNVQTTPHSTPVDGMIEREDDTNWVWDAARSAWLSEREVGPFLFKVFNGGLTALTTLKSGNCASNIAPVICTTKMRLIGWARGGNGTITNTDIEIMKNASTQVLTLNLTGTGWTSSMAADVAFASGDYFWTRVDPTPGGDSISQPMVELYFKRERP